MPTCPQCHTGYDPNVALCPRDGSELVSDSSSLGVPGASEFASSSGSSPSLPDPLIGALLAGKFLVSRRIGEGGMGIVYQATHTGIGREVAVKVLHERYIERREVAQRLVNEARLASAIQNEHIVDIFDFGETGDGRTFVVMELLDGQSLSQLIASEGALPEARAIGICLQIASALHAAHRRGIVHRDVKPENMFVLPRDGGDFVKVLDFGISKAMRPDEIEPALRLTHTGMVLGTPLYMSPEQARGEDQIDHRIDVYALGVILYECLTGEVPFRGTNYLGIISDVLSRIPPSPRRIRPELLLSPALDQVVARAMERDRERRYPSMDVFAEDLRRVQAGEPLEPVAAAPTVPMRRGGRHRVVYASILLVAVVATALTVFLARPGVASRNAAARAPDTEINTFAQTHKSQTVPAPTPAPVAAPTPVNPSVSAAPSVAASTSTGLPAPSVTSPEIQLQPVAAPATAEAARHRQRAKNHHRKSAGDPLAADSWEQVQRGH